MLNFILMKIPSCEIQNLMYYNTFFTDQFFPMNLKKLIFPVFFAKNTDLFEVKHSTT